MATWYSSSILSTSDFIRPPTSIVRRFLHGWRFGTRRSRFRGRRVCWKVWRRSSRHCGVVVGCTLLPRSNTFVSPRERACCTVHCDVTERPVDHRCSRRRRTSSRTERAQARITGCSGRETTGAETDSEDDGTASKDAGRASGS